eukprot:3696922-Rhodomonas_salina.1
MTNPDAGPELGTMAVTVDSTTTRVASYAECCTASYPSLTSTETTNSSRPKGQGGDMQSTSLGPAGATRSEAAIGGFGTERFAPNVIN